MFEFIAIGASWGSTNALKQLLGCLPPDFPLPVAVVLHREQSSEMDAIVDRLQAGCALPVAEVEDKQAILPGQVYLAPPDYHLLVEPGHFALSTDEPENYSRPSIDMLFETAAEVFGSKVLGVILTGASADGIQGLITLQHCGGTTILQDPSSTEVRAMPPASLAASLESQVGTPEEIGELLKQIAYGQR